MVALGAGAFVLAGLGWSAKYLAGMRPPGCTDPSTLALVGYRLAQLLGPIPPPSLGNVKIIDGGTLAIRFVCTADLTDPDRIKLANGGVIQWIQFTSMLGHGRVQHVSVRLEPIVQWEKVQ